MTDITLRSIKGAPLTHDELDTNFSNLKETADAAFAAVAGVGGKANAAALGVSDNATTMGTFSGSLISDNVTAKAALQELESAIESGAASATTKANASAIGIAASDTNLGTFTGSTIPDSQNAKQALQALETAVEGKEPTLAAGTTGQYYRGDKSWQTLDKSAAGLGNVDNTSDANKPVSTATQTELYARARAVSSRSALAALISSNATIVLTESGRDGVFVWSGADLSTQVTNDPGQGIYVPPSSAPTGASGAWVRKFSGPIFPWWFGAVGDGTTSDQTAFANMATYANANAGTEISLGAKTYKITANVTFNNTVSMYGVTAVISKILCVGTCSILFDGGTGSTIYFARQQPLRRFGIVQSGVNTGQVLFVGYNATADTRGTIPGGVIEDVDVSVENTSASFDTGILLRDIPNLRMNRVRVEGTRTSPLPCIYGIRLITTSGNGSAADPVFEDVRCFFVRTGADISGEVEGVNFVRPLMVGVRTGIYWDAGAGAFQPSLWVTDGHINAEGSAITAINIVDAKIQGNEFFGQGADGGTSALNVVDITLNAGVGARLNIRISGNMFQGDLNYGEPSDRVSRAINLTGHASDVENAIISDNFFQTYDTAINIGANVNGVTVSDTNQFNNCTANVSDGATNGANIIAIRSESGTHWQRKLNDGTILKGGSTTVALDASGNGSISLATAGAVFPNGLLSAVVCNGDEGTAGDASFVVRWGSSTASSLAVAVRPNPGAVTVRVNYSATGK